MNAFFVWLESTAFSVWMRESVSIFAFPAILSLHTVGMGVLAGLNTAIALRILGAAPRVPMMEMRRLFPIIWFGFYLNAASGLALLIGYPTKALTNPVFYLKLAFIALGILLQMRIRRRVFGDPALDQSPVPRGGRALAMASLACWAGAIASGRLLAYTYTRLLA